MIIRIAKWSNGVHCASDFNSNRLHLNYNNISCYWLITAYVKAWASKIKQKKNEIKRPSKDCKSESKTEKKSEKIIYFVQQRLACHTCLLYIIAFVAILST